MLAPPPIPNRPARIPVTTPPAMIAPASSASSENGTPVSTSGRDVGRGGTRVRHQTDRLTQNPNAGTGLDGLRRDVAPKCTRAGHPLKQAQDVPGHCMQPRTARKLAFDVRKKPFEHCFGGGERRRRTVDQRIDAKTPTRILIGSPAHHHPETSAYVTRRI